MRIRIVIVFFLFLFAMGGLGFRLMYMADQPVALHHGAQRLTVAQSRGAILDRNGQPIVHAYRQMYAAARPSVRASEALRGMLTQERWLEADRRLSYGNLIALRVPNAQSAPPTPDIVLVDVYPRYGPQQPAVHLIGHLDQNGAGVHGLERAFDNLLGGASGALTLRLAADARGHGLAGAQLEVHDENYLSTAGIQLTIDLRIQRIVENAMRRHGLSPGAVVVLCVETGDILAMASSPDFNPNNIAASLGNPQEPFFNRALGAYPIGSTFKTFIAAAALDQRIPATRQYFCQGQMLVGGRIFRCINEIAHGYVDMGQAFAQSCNLYFIRLAAQLQLQPMLDLVRLFGFGEETVLAPGIRDARGNVPAEAQLAHAGEMANFSFGQGLLLGTPLQMAAATAAIANGGVYHSPALVKATIDENGAVTPFVNDRETRQVISPEVAQYLREMMLLTVRAGTGRSARPEEGGAGGKTATAQSGQFNEDGSEILQTSFTGFFPAQTPAVAITVFREDGVSGAADGGPVFAEIANQLTAGGEDAILFLL